MKILFINTSKAQCSIYESGLMTFSVLQMSQNYSIDYIEAPHISEKINIDKYSQEVSLLTGYDVYLFNYHLITMPWQYCMFFIKLTGIKLTLVLEVAKNDPFARLSEVERKFFDGFLVLDPTLSPQENVFAFPRPLETHLFNPPVADVCQSVPVIGSYSFPGLGKYHYIVDAVNREFSKAVIRFNLPQSTYGGIREEHTTRLVNDCFARVKKGIDLVVTHDYLSKEELIQWCSENTLNCFLYDRDIPGLAATTDQAILSGRPLAVSRSTAFRHITAYLPPYPEWSLMRSIEESSPIVAKMRYEWSAERFVELFEKVLSQFTTKKINKVVPHKDYIKQAKQWGKKHSGIILFRDAVSSKAKAILMNKENKTDIFSKSIVFLLLKVKTVRDNLLGNKNKSQRISYSQLYEDMWIDRLFHYQTTGFYIDVGANHPSVCSVTKFFYDNGWRGINIEPNPELHALFEAERPRDTNLQIDNSELESMTLGQICTHHLPQNISTIEFMSIDAGGCEEKVIKGGDWSEFRPRLLIIKAVKPGKLMRHPIGDKEYALWGGWEPLLTAAGYQFCLFDGLNRYYLREEDSFLKEYFSIPVSPLLDDFIK